jgi:hypothetical protein
MEVIHVENTLSVGDDIFFTAVEQQDTQKLMGNNFNVLVSINHSRGFLICRPLG